MGKTLSVFVLILVGLVGIGLVEVILIFLMFWIGYKNRHRNSD